MFVGAGTILTLVHATVIEMKNYSNYNEKRLYEFSVGSVEENIMDNLKSGDIVLFNRPWYKYHLPIAAVLLMYRSITKAEFDHAGVIVKDKFGTPFLIENTPFKGVQCRKFSDRLKYSQSRQIVVIPLDKSVLVHPGELIPRKFHKYSELRLNYWWIFWSVLNTVVPNLADTGGACPNAFLVLETLNSLGLQVATRKTTSHPPGGGGITNDITIQDFVSRNICFRPVAVKSRDESAFSEAALTYLRSNDVVLRDV